MRSLRMMKDRKDKKIPVGINPRTAIVFLHDFVAAWCAWLFSYSLRFNLTLPAEYGEAALRTLVWVLPLEVFFFWWFGLYRGVWRFASLSDLQRILKAVGSVAVAVPVALVLLREPNIVPRSVLFLNPILLLCIMGGSRIMYRSWKEHRLAALFQPGAKPVLILGAGAAAESLIRELRRCRTEYRAVGLLCDRVGQHGRCIHNVPVLGPLDDVAHWATRMHIDDVIMALPAESHGKRQRLLDLCNKSELRVLTIPSLEDLVQGRVTVSDLRPIELDDLLGRDPVQLDTVGLDTLLSGQVILVTGAGGSIGSELCRQVARFRPRRLVLVESSEFALYRMEQEFRKVFPDLDCVWALGDVKDGCRMRELMQKYLPQVVYHAAAYKHVPLVERENGLQALRNNVLGTWVTARAAREAGVERFVMISTDKAVNPTNIMGASKRLAEMACQSLSVGQQEKEGNTCFVSVRFGNVLGSSGSVIPKFQEQIAAGGPVTVTHPEISRYFMSIPEAAQLVLQASLMGHDGEIYVLEMGEPVKIADLAQMMIRLAGKQDTVKVEYTGLRPGEKLYEELIGATEATLATPHPKLQVIQACRVDQEIISAALHWIETTPSCSEETLREQVRAWVPKYRPAGSD